MEGWRLQRWVQCCSKDVPCDLQVFPFLEGQCWDVPSNIASKLRWSDVDTSCLNKMGDDEKSGTHYCMRPNFHSSCNLLTPSSASFTLSNKLVTLPQPTPVLFSFVLHWPHLAKCCIMALPNVYTHPCNSRSLRYNVRHFVFLHGLGK
jgi:hypothetical protein